MYSFPWEFVPLFVRVVYGGPLGRCHLGLDIPQLGFGGGSVGGLEGMQGLSRTIASVECSWMIGAEKWLDSQADVAGRVPYGY